MKFFADHCVPDSIIRGLQEAGHAVHRLRDHLPTNSIDEEVIAQAQRLDAILISVNGDFSDIVRYPPARYKGIFALQIKNHPEVIPHIISRLVECFLGQSDPEYYKGKLFLVEAHRIRVR